jgi:hypothetical protein
MLSVKSALAVRRTRDEGKNRRELTVDLWAVQSCFVDLRVVEVAEEG